MLIGVLALQGAFREHQKMFEYCGIKTVQVRMPEQLNNIDALVIPGGESTTMSKLLVEYDLLNPIIELGQKGLPIMGTCAGLVLLAREIVNSNQQPVLQLMDIKVKRNAFGRQRESFETDLDITELGELPLRAVFIRAPYVVSAGENVKVLSSFKNKIICVEQQNLIGVAFHPELTKDIRLHRYFINKIPV
ncbi:MAG: pyridoxal 5'-phosphate synthase glutaminase subunit PdxT [Clostridiales bacterium]|nr:pyridoxal 5'-phosphate synthase glutaminase subunit PdxT [Clostridiales bacterium]MCF8021521.1 pyridoxal 5'-phosphate synthase glutaminase subunit PdxT [Clostridiales bacterium]